MGLRADMYDRGICGLVAALAYTQGGRARGALALMQKAAEVAETSQCARIKEPHVRMAVKLLDEAQGSDLIRRLPPPQRAILAFILTNSPTNSAAETWWSTWAAEHGLGRTRRTLQRYVKELETLALVNKTVRSLGRARGTLATLAVAPELVETVSNSLATLEDFQATPLSTMSPVTNDTDFPGDGSGGS